MGAELSRRLRESAASAQRLSELEGRLAARSDDVARLQATLRWGLGLKCRFASGLMARNASLLAIAYGRASRYAEGHWLGPGALACAPSNACRRFRFMPHMPLTHRAQSDKIFQQQSALSRAHEEARELKRELDARWVQKVFWSRGMCQVEPCMLRNKPPRFKLQVLTWFKLRCGRVVTVCGVPHAVHALASQGHAAEPD